MAGTSPGWGGWAGLEKGEGDCRRQVWDISRPAEPASPWVPTDTDWDQHYRHKRSLSHKRQLSWKRLASFWERNIFKP